MAYKHDIIPLRLIIVGKELLVGCTKQFHVVNLQEGHAKLSSRSTKHHKNGSRIGK